MAAIGSPFRRSAGRNWPTRIGPLLLALFLGLALLVGRRGTATFDASPRNEQTVVVYYANGTTAQAINSEPYQSLLNILAASGRMIGTDLAAALTQDARAFSSSVQHKATEFLTQARRRKFDLAIFTNELALAHQYVFFSADAQRLDNLSFVPTSNSTHPFLKTAPLAQAEALRQALLDVVRHYPATPLRVLLIVHSHGTHDMALMPRVSMDLDHATPQEIATALDAGAQATPPDWARLQGTTKAEFWRVLRDIDATYNNVSFPLVVRASCESGLGSWQEYFAIPGNIGLIAHTGMRQLDMRSEPLDLIFGNGDGSLSLQDLSPAIRRAGFDVDTTTSLAAWLVPVTLWQIPVFVYFIPAIVLLICFSLMAASKHLHRKFGFRHGTSSGSDFLEPGLVPPGKS